MYPVPEKSFPPDLVTKLKTPPWAMPALLGFGTAAASEGFLRGRVQQKGKPPFGIEVDDFEL